jgi:hypothetical protein
MSHSYTKLGNSCQSQTHAITSNEKYISPFSSVYYKTYTPMLYYPGHERMFEIRSKNYDYSFPEHHKAYSSTQEQDTMYIYPGRKNIKPCETCKS